MSPTTNHQPTAAPSNPPARGSHYFLPQEHVLFGPGSLESLPAEAARLAGQRTFLITGRSIAGRTDFIERIRGLMGNRLAGTFAEVRQHTPEGDVARAAETALALDADLLISLGGGSPIDATKAVARRLHAAHGRRIPHLAIPTTLSAAEFSHLVGVTDEARRAKTGFSDPQLVPRVVLLDAELTLPTPIDLWLSSGMRALDHAVETLYSPGLHPIADVMALEAVERLVRHLPASQRSPEDLGLRTELQLAAWMSFFGEVNTPMGMSHILGRRIGATYNVPHGITSCITLPWVMEAKAETEAPALAAIGRRTGAAPPEAGDAEAARAAAQDVRRLVRELGLPGRLREVGVPEEALDAIAEAAYSDGAERRLAREMLGKMW